ncbi:hypothetical protein FS837_001597 [Tulasnella sp. UAMH 9824]|nr:hypothetical protein FS837_001597 [Tulasnella sp. UAMH 9824]
MTLPVSATTFKSLWETCASHRSIRNAKRFAVAFSGGPDSLCLLFLLHQYFKSKHLEQNIVSLTINHDLQAASQRMTARCRELSASLGIPNVVMSIPWSQPPFPPKPLPGQAIEEVARAARSQLLFDAMQQHECDALVMGHHADDQVETALMRLLRRGRVSENGSTGSEVALHNSITRPYRRWGMGFKSQSGTLGWAGLPGMDKWIIRPLLNLPKDRLIATCRENKLDYVEDSTNFNPALTPRNAVRAVLAGREVSALPEADVRSIHDAIDKARRMALASPTVGAGRRATTIDILRIWVRGLEQTRENLDSDDQIIQSKLELSKIQKHALIRRILRYVSPRAWGSTEAEANGRTESLERISERLFRSIDPTIPSDIAKLGAGADVLWKPVAIGNDGRIERLQPGVGRPKPTVGWLAHRSPPRAVERDAQVDVTSKIRERLANTASRKVVEVLWDCRFALTLKPWLLSDDVKTTIIDNLDGVSVTVEAGGEWMLPSVVLRRAKSMVVIGGYPKRRGEFIQLPWVDIRFIRKLSAL